MAVSIWIMDFMVSSYQWNPFEACEDKNIATTITVDEFASFDHLSFDILDKKLELYNFDQSVRNWMESYLRLRTNYVNIGAAKYIMKTISIGVPKAQS